MEYARTQWPHWSSTGYVLHWNLRVYFVECHFGLLGFYSREISGIVVSKNFKRGLGSESDYIVVTTCEFNLGPCFCFFVQLYHLCLLYFSLYEPRFLGSTRAPCYACCCVDLENLEDPNLNACELFGFDSKEWSKMTGCHFVTNAGKQMDMERVIPSKSADLKSDKSWYIACSRLRFSKLPGFNTIMWVTLWNGLLYY